MQEDRRCAGCGRRLDDRTHPVHGLAYCCGGCAAGERCACEAEPSVRALPERGSGWAVIAPGRIEPADSSDEILPRRPRPRLPFTRDNLARREDG